MPMIVSLFFLLSIVDAHIYPPPFYHEKEKKKKIMEKRKIYVQRKSFLFFLYNNRQLCHIVLLSPKGPTSP
ncbi:hypothetical protein BDV38DRAFT_234477 [Aspergillus pseudotamarii]|uniref:Secreted protein n=1 Tax=Aspergillus pseudotamarii TaxID=132259 RepID=A0A5N6T9I5_ASPPS|nr:uncharacterized protein BDV38DRAFT_234477 [Aspergillus pseudotamarii]KAE8143034.1 hypothetical protein BDV38DRAFT_234477 [Aspergillus pseudotamarii]